MAIGVKGWLISLISLLMVGCASLTSLPSGAKKILITEKPVSKRCVWMKKVTFYNPGHPPLSLYQHAMLERDEFNKLRIQAYQAGGNVIFLSEFRMIKRNKKSKDANQKMEETHLLIGEVYRCPID